MAEPTLLQQARICFDASRETAIGEVHAVQFNLLRNAVDRILRYLEERHEAGRAPRVVPEPGTKTSNTTPSACFDALDLDALQALCDAAHPPPWTFDHASGFDHEDAAFTTAARDALPKLIATVRRLNDELEREHVRLAGCAVACARTEDPALKPGDYGWSASYGDVIRLRERMERAEARVRDLERREQRLMPALQAFGIDSITARTVIRELDRGDHG